MDRQFDAVRTTSTGDGTALDRSSAPAAPGGGRLRRAVVVAGGAALLGLSVIGGASADGRHIQIGTHLAAPVCYSDEIGTYYCHPTSATGTFYLKNTNAP